jgi:two-component system sensor histidine kinase QseC
VHSIRIFLVVGILATLTLFNFLAALQGYQSSMAEADILFDNQMEDIAQLVASIDIAASGKEIVLENGMIFQIWEGDKLLVASADAPLEAVTASGVGFDYSNFDSYRWRTFTQFDAATSRRVIVAERTDFRFVLAENVILESIIPILLGIPLVGLLIWTIVSLGLRPLKQLSGELKHKQANDFSPVHYENTTRELEQVIESTNGFIKRLGEVLEREQRFSADAAHELRTPISALKIQLHNLSEEIDTNNDSYRQLHSGVERMQHLIEQLLSLYRTTPEKFAENCHRVDLFQIAQDEIAKMYGNFEKKGQALELEGHSVEIEGDQFALETLMSNLLSNANKYTPAGGNILVRVVEKPTTAELSVADSGSGIALADRERVLDRFYRADSTADDAMAPGGGLGLTIVAHIAELHHAQLTIGESEFETGVAFRICFEKKI